MGRSLERTAVFTHDLDCITQHRVPVQGIGLLDSLEAAGFEWVPKGDATPPAAVFVWPSKDHREVEVEFLVPARGDGRNRVVTIQPHLTAQALRDLDILLDDPVVVELDERSEEAGLVFKGPVRVPRPAHFSIQKALIFSRRAPEDQVKDLAYVFDLIDSANGLAERVLSDVVLADRRRYQAEVQRFREVLRRELGSPAFVKKVAEQIPLERRPLSTYIGREVAQWLERLEAALRA